MMIITTLIVFPFLSRTLVFLEYSSGNASDGSLMETAVYGIIRLTTSYFFIPIWILVLIGQEFSNGHVNLVVFHKSYWYYFMSKIYFSIIASVIFTVIGVISVALVHQAAPLGLFIPEFFYITLVCQLFFTFLGTSVVLMCIIFLIRSPVIGFVFYLVLSFTEGIVFLIVKKLYEIDLYLLPLHIPRLLFLRNGEPKFENYYNPFTNFDSIVMLVPIYLLALLIITYLMFKKINLKPLSD